MTTALAPTHAAWALLGATGVTGRLILERALSAGMRPKLIGRNPGRLEALAQPHGLSWAAAPLQDPAALEAGLNGCAAVVNVAGPFVSTAPRVISACLSLQVDYLDLSGELASLRKLAELDVPARGAGVVLVGGVGFGVAATDALVRRVSKSLGGAERLRIAVAADSAFGSQAVAESTIEVLGGGGWMVSGGKLVRSRLAARRWREVAPDGRTSPFASAPLADLVGALQTSDAGEIVAGVPMAPLQAAVISTIAPALPLLLRFPPMARRLAGTGGHDGSHATRPRRSRTWVTGWRGTRSSGLMFEGGEGFGVAADLAMHAPPPATDARRSYAGKRLRRRLAVRPARPFNPRDPSLPARSLVMPETISFKSRDARCVGWLYLPDGSGAAPGVAMAHGFSGVKEMDLPAFAARFAAAGYAVLLFDYRGFGESEGEPRGRLDPTAQIEDYRNALSFLGEHPRVDADRLAVWGTSFSGAHVLHLGAFDPRVRAVVSQVPAIDVQANARRLMPEAAMTAMLTWMTADRRAHFRGEEPARIPVVAPLGQICMLPSPES